MTMNTISNRLLQLAAVSALGAGLTFAQDTDLRLTVPFDFIVAGKTLPAGEYVLQSSAASPFLTVMDSYHRPLAVTMITARVYKADRTADSRMVFRVVGTKYYLASTWNGRIAERQDFRRTAAEREQEMAGVPAHGTVLVATK